MKLKQAKKAEDEIGPEGLTDEQILALQKKPPKKLTEKETIEKKREKKESKNQQHKWHSD